MAVFSRRVGALMLGLSLLITPLRLFAQEGTKRTTTKTTAIASSNAPLLSSITPAAVAVGSGSFVLSVVGSNFLSTSEVLWNGSPRPVNFISSSQRTPQFLHRTSYCLEVIR